MTCDECNLTTRDSKIMERHNCDITLNSGKCEDAPCCGHEMGDCNGMLYGSDEAIKERAYRDMSDQDDWYAYEGHEDECDNEDCHTLGSCNC